MAGHKQKLIAHEARRFEPVSDAVVLAAIDRAERHSGRRGEGASMNNIAEHLGFIHGSWTTRGLRPHVDALIQAEALVRGSATESLRGP